MNNSEQTLIEQLKITRHEIERRKKYFNITEKDVSLLVSLRDFVGENIDEVVEEFYKKILPYPEMDRLIGDSETLRRLKIHQRNYIFNLFDGQYDEEYVHSRLRIGVVHKRIGLQPKFYVSSVYNLSSILRNVIVKNSGEDCSSCEAKLSAIEKIIMFDLSLTFDTYIHSLMDDLKRSEEELEQYTESLEEIISERTKLLRQQARHDGLTNLLNQQAFYSELKRVLLRGQRNNHATVLIYFDLDGFKKLNDTQGHKKGDELLTGVAQAMRKTLRETDILARYGGDEFCIVIDESSIEEAEQVCQKLSSAIEAATEDSGVSCSMGIAISLPENSYDANTLVRTADKAMYKAKNIKGFSIVIADE